ncbi:MAG: hypothetical protein EP334_06055 [Gammaproteobacteria bacterium]|nr:MAG: hypothetical protein EP334_06055 [Gammaproteobacteria bacterium]
MVFYEKPGCINNRRQKTILLAAGFDLDVRNLLEASWQPAELRHFFDGMPVSDWFNLAAPRVKSGEIDPRKMSEQQALAAMVDDPLLIRRPLLACGSVRQSGFNLPRLMAALGRDAEDAPEVPANIETCSKGANHQGCRHEEGGA